MRNISINNFDLNDTNNITVNLANHDSAPIRDYNILQLARQDKAKVVSSQLTPKKITIEGRITGDTVDDLEINIDDFKRILNASNMALQIAYASGTRTYYVELSSLVIARQSYHITYAPFTMEFVAADPAGYGTSYTKSWDGITTSQYDCTFTADGSMYPEPVVTINITSETSTGQIRINNETTGKEIRVSMDFSAGDEIIISMITNSVTVNGTQTDYTGAFPSFVTGANNLIATFTGQARNVDLSVTYRPRWL